MDIKDCIKFKESLIKIMSETILLRDLIMAEIEKYKPFEESEKKEEVKNEEVDLSKKVNKKVSKPRPVNKIIEEVKEQEKEEKKPKRQAKTKKESIVIDTENLTLEI